MRQKRTGGNLTIKLRRPAAGNAGSAVGTRSLAGQAIILNQVCITLDQGRAAVVTAGIFQIANLPGKIPRIHVPQS